uniref:Nudix hydrolase domain-containing protein n=1 Tax=Corethron hystrix TaxID=216773 RepID=A0A7S1G188_9STRA|mmetsp:Transcript_42820/g.100538  ORF Transcript_42820/g.100538 Transcript_42820/m.100538 type:complete len:237 (+) Transcript_42820:270-980(+)
MSNNTFSDLGSRPLALALLSFVSGAASAMVYMSFGPKEKRKRIRDHAGASPPGDDHSLFYGDRTVLSTTKKEWTFLPKDVYSEVVHNCIVACVDCVVVRTNIYTGIEECLLVERSDDPAKGLWWLPGGRIFKGETFFAAALRKTKDETGIDGRAIQMLGFYNTFFPTSAWDDDQRKGTQTVNAVVLIQITNSEISLDRTSQRFRWISTDVDDASRYEDPYVVACLKSLHSWKKTYG